MPISAKYQSCLKCGNIIGNHLRELHEIDCHQMNQFNFTHPFIRDGCLYSQLNVIREDAIGGYNYSLKDCRTKSTDIYSEHYPGCQVVNEMKSGKIPFLSKFAYMNAADMVISNIQAYSSVILEINGKEDMFLVVPDEQCPLSSISIYESALKNLSQNDGSSLGLVKKCGDVTVAGRVVCSLRSSINYSDLYTLDKSVKLKFLTYISIGRPSLLAKCGIVNLNFLDYQEFVVTPFSGVDATALLCINDNDFQTSNSSSIINETFRESNNSHLQSPSLSYINNISKDMEKLDIDPLLDCSSKKKKYCRTSTPTTTTTEHKKGRRRKKKGNNILCDETINISSIQDIYHQSTCYLLDRTTSISTYDNEIETKDKWKPNVGPYFYKDETYKTIKNLIAMKVEDHINCRFSLRSLWSGIIISGHTGTGKTALVQELSSELNMPMVILSLFEWARANLTVAEYITKVLNKAKSQAPSIIFIDEIDSLCSQDIKRSSEGFTSHIFRIIAEVKTLDSSVILICATSRPEDVPVKLKECGRFDKEFVLHLPQGDKKETMLWNLLSHYDHLVLKEEVSELARLARGFSASDLMSLVRTAHRKAYERWKKSEVKSQSLNICYDDVVESITSVVPSFLRHNFTSVAEVRWADIHGYESVKESIKEILENRSKDGSLHLKGVLLYGPPGCSKTMLVKAIATETKLTYFPIKCSDLLSQYVGETEKALCKLFGRASLSSPSLIFMDEIDSLCGERSGQGSTEASVVTELLSLMKKTRMEGNIMVIGATNRPQCVDQALLSPGYLELTLLVDLPDCASRCAIWRALLQGVPSEDIAIDYLCRKSEGFSGAEVMAIYQKSVQTLFELHHQKSDGEEIYLTKEVLDKTMSSFVPCSSPASVNYIRQFSLMRKRS